MKNVWEVIKKVLIWIGTIFVAIFTVLFVKEQRKNAVVSTGSTTADDSEVINAKAEKKREEAIEKIEHSDARTIAEEYDGVCDAIADGKERFRRCVADCGRRD